MAEILLVDDERVVREGMKRVLQGEGFCVRTARDGEEAVRQVGERRPDLVLLDVMMPKMNGFRCCEEIRRSDVLLPVIFLTAKDSESDQVRGISLGADGYLPKSAGDALLLACVRRALARARELRETELRRAADVIYLGAVSVDLRALTVRSEAGAELALLTRTEADILKVLDARRGELFSSDELIAAVRGKGYACEDTMLYMHLSNLRRKLGPAAGKLVNRRRAGYCLSC